MKLVVTIDTEEDNMAHYNAVDNHLENIEQIPNLQKVFDRYGVKPTYLVTYPVASDAKSAAVLRGILARGGCEIGMHCHSWNTPPFNEEKPIQKRDTMLCNLDKDMVHAKLSTLHEKIQNSFGITPVSFRAGRFGFGPATAASLVKLGYRIDSSVTPFMSWKKNQGPDFSEFYPDPFRFSPQGLAHKETDGPLLEVPVTIGFLQSDFTAANQRLKALERPFARRLHIAGILGRLGLLNRIWLSPEIASADEMIRLAKRMQKNGYPVINLTFHSTSLRRRSGPFVKTRTDEQAFSQKIDTFLKYAFDSGWESVSLKEFEDSVNLYKAYSKVSESIPGHTLLTSSHCDSREETPKPGIFGSDRGLQQGIKDLFPQRFKGPLKRSFQNILQSLNYRSSACRAFGARESIRNAAYVVFVCKGNICRSPFAAHALHRILSLDSVRIESCGLDVDRQMPSPPEAVKAAGKFGVDLSAHLSKGISDCDMKGADLIVPMEYYQLSRIVEMFPEYRGKTLLLRQFAPFPHNVFCNIYDPYGGSKSEYTRCFTLINKSLRGVAFYMSSAGDIR
ncbi:MAG: hypothetical protein K9J79_10155 [Desulfobacteraceae bacterium]|nr:hypothetical protein [Desulfobacteraceae bacterium]